MAGRKAARKTKTLLEDLPKRDQKILLQWLEVMEEIEEIEAELEKLRARESKIAAKLLKVLRKVDEEAVRVTDGVVALVRRQQMVSRPKYKVLYEKALPHLSKRLQKTLENLKESMVKYKVVEKPTLIKGGSVKEKAKRVVDAVKGWVRSALRAIKELIAWIRAARKFNQAVREVLRTAK